MAKKIFTGSGGGSAPINMEDTLLSEDVVEFALAVSEGPIRGLAKGAQSFLVGDTQLVSETGVKNFDKFAIGVHPGYSEGAAKPLALKLGGVSSNTPVGVTLRSQVPVTRQTEAQLRGSIDELEIRIQFQSLYYNDDKGNSKQNMARFKIEYKAAATGTVWLPIPGSGVSGIPDPGPANGGSIHDAYRLIWLQQAVGTDGTIEVFGKTTSGYVKEFRIPVPRLANDDWLIRVTKVSVDNSTTDVVNLAWESFQATTIGARAFPDTAIVHGLGVANGQFSSIPDFAGIFDGLVIRVPSNYNPDLRTYDESTPWTGTFKFAWTNNPAWILYDLIVNTRYGLAKHRRYVDANRFSFYQAAKWCDQAVPVPGGGTRPRYTFNGVLSETRQAMEMLQYVAGSFNGLIWDDLQGQVHLRVDKDDPAVMLFSPESVTESGFEYSFSDISSRANDISVGFINPDLDWNEDRRRIPNITTSEAHIEKYGRTPLDFIAVGCTNLHEALAKAQVRLISSLTETTTVSFTTTRQGAMLSLYDIILVADPFMGWSQPGRLTSYDNQWLNFRDSIFIETMGDYKVNLQTVTGLVEVRVRPESTGHVQRFHLLDMLPDNIPAYTVFTIKGTESLFGYPKPFRVLAIEEVDGSPYQYRITGVEINRNKYIQAEGQPTDVGKDFDYSTKDPYLPGQPTNFTAASGDEHLTISQTGAVISRIYCSWRKPFGAIVNKYVLQHKLLEDLGNEWQTINTSELNAYVTPVLPGSHYSLRVASIDKDGNQSAWLVITDHEVIGKKKIPAGVTGLTALGGVFQVSLSWVNPIAPDTKKIEIWAGTTNSLTQATKMTDLAYPTNTWRHLGLGIDVTINYWVRVQDSSGNYSPWSPMVQGRTTKDPSEILAILEGQITSSQLFAELATRIDLVDGPVDLPGSVAQQIKAEARAREAALLTAMGNIDSKILNEVNTRQTADTAISQQYNTLLAKVNLNATNSTAALTYEAQTRATQIAAVSYDLALLNAAHNSTKASLTDERNTRASEIGSLTSRVSTMSTTVGQQTIAIQEVTRTVNGVYAEKYIKLDIDGRVSGWGIAGSAATGSDFIVRADRFGFALPGQSAKLPFMIGLINGVQTTGINGALVIDGTLVVKQANIENAAIGTLKIAGQAVTIPVTAIAGNELSGNGSLMTALSVSLYMPEAGTIYAASTGFIGYGGGWQPSVLTQLEINGSIVSQGGGEAWVNAAHSGSLQVESGWHTVTLKFKSPGSQARMGFRSLYASAALR